MARKKKCAPPSRAYRRKRLRVGPLCEPIARQRTAGRHRESGQRSEDWRESPVVISVANSPSYQLHLSLASDRTRKVRVRSLHEIVQVKVVNGGSAVPAQCRGMYLFQYVSTISSSPPSRC